MLNDTMDQVIMARGLAGVVSITTTMVIILTTMIWPITMAIIHTRR